LGTVVELNICLNILLL